MADQKISQLVDGGAPQATDEFVVDRAGTDNFKLDWASLDAAVDFSQAVILAPAASSRNVIQPSAGDVIAAVLKDHAAQSVDLTQWQKSDGTVLAALTKDASFVSSPTADVSNLLLTGLASRTNPIIKIVDLITGFSPPRALEVRDANDNRLVSIYSEKFFSGTNRSGVLGAAAWDTAGNALGTALIDGSGFLDLGVVTTCPYPIYVYDFAAGSQIFTVTKAGVPIFGGHAATSSGDLEASNFSFWLTDTNDAAALNVKAKQADGTVKTLVLPVTNGTAALTSDLSAYVPNSLFDANTVLAANSDNTPAALTMGASTILARLAAGNIKAASVAEILTLLGSPYTPGGTDVPITDGGTGASTAAAALTNLGAAAALITENVQTASYGLVLADAFLCVVMNVAGANNLTVPLNSSQAFPVGTIIEVFQLGAGQTTIVATGGVTIRSSGAKLKLTGQYSGASLRKRDTDEWTLVGDIAA